MKKSNQLLLAAFLTMVLVLAGIHLALSAKYKNGNYTVYNEMESGGGMDVRALANIQQVRVENVGYVTVRYDATPSIKYTKGNKDVKITQQGGVLTVTMPKAADGEGARDLSVHLYVDSNIMVNLVNSRAYLVNTGERNSRLHVGLNSTYLTTSDDVNTENFFVESLQLAATNKSEVQLNEINVNQLSLNLQQSSFTERKSVFQNIQLQADDSSRIALSSSNFLKITKTNINE